MNNSWLSKVIPIALLFSFRMLGLFMLIPVFSVIANQLDHATPALIGVALGSYGLSQGLCQIPFGLLSDRYGRKPILLAGLSLFAIGSLMGAITHSIYGMIFARILQGMGAIGSVLIALLADLTKPEQRTKGMAIIGLTIGVSFSIAMVLSPAIAHHYGLAGIFYFTLFLALCGFVILLVFIPTPQREGFHAEAETNPRLLRTVLKNTQLHPLNFGIFCQHFILTSTFYAVPILLRAQANNGALQQQWHFYLPLMVLSFIGMLPFIYIAERKRKMQVVFPGAIFILLLSQLFLFLSPSTLSSLFLIIFLYFVAFNILEASLPSLISKIAPTQSRGTAMGVYSTSQFLGIFAGGSCAGFITQKFHLNGIFLSNAFLCLIWLVYSKNLTTITSAKN